MVMPRMTSTEVTRVSGLELLVCRIVSAACEVSTGRPGVVPSTARRKAGEGLLRIRGGCDLVNPPLHAPRPARVLLDRHTREIDRFCLTGQIVKGHAQKRRRSSTQEGVYSGTALRRPRAGWVAAQATLLRQAVEKGCALGISPRARSRQRLVARDLTHRAAQHEIAVAPV